MNVVSDPISKSICIFNLHMKFGNIWRRDSMLVIVHENTSCIRMCLLLNKIEHLLVESSAMLSKGAGDTHCTECGNKGYPSWHPKFKKFPQRKNISKQSGFKGKPRENELQSVNQVEATSTAPTLNAGYNLTQQQVEQLIKLLPIGGIMYCSCATTTSTDWILDTGAADHMTPAATTLTKLHSNKSKSHINLSNGHTGCNETKPI
ncbi:hypothetical protein Cgig2_007099 [Carnegiea gigantea]|uniref:Uncharacterized protein n=1 Tax=Carnegiea gigantea TaxID=171969 RepID=A0A9Q1Q702_9CARY|nr:hypothetical protein Cgig2_007099 [Carnegiea gigantea]